MSPVHNYKSLFKHLPLPALVIDAQSPDFTIIDANREFYTVFTGEETDVINCRFFDVIPGDLNNPDDIKAKVHHHSLKKVIQTGEPDHMGTQKYKYVNKKTGKNESAYYQIKNTPVTDDAGNVKYILHTIRDVSIDFARKQRMERSEKRYRALVEYGNDVLLILDKEGNPFYVSPNVFDVLGYTTDEIKSKKPEELIHPDDLPNVMKEMGIAHSNPAMPISVTPARMKHKNGRWRWMTGTITNMIHDPAIGGIVDNFRDITEQVEAQNKILEANEKFQSLVHTIDGIFWEADAKTFIFEYMSPQVEKMLGYSAEDWVGMPDFWQSKIHPEDREQAIEYCHYETKAGRNHEFEYRFRKADGEYIWLRDVVTVVNENDQPSKLRGLMLDISEHKKLEQNLTDAYELSKIGTWELNLESNELKWSKFIKELHEVDPDFEPDLETAINFYEKGNSRDKIEKSVVEAISNNEKFDVELTIITAKGNRKWVRAVGKPKIVNGTVVAIYGSTQDITARKTAEIAKEEARRSLQNILNQSMDVICVIDKDGRFERVSAASEHVWGYEPQDLEGKEYINYVIPEDRDITRQAAKDIMSGVNQTNFENRYRHKNGDVIPIVWAVRWSETDQKMYAIARDARELKEAQKKLRDTEQHLRNIVEHSTNLFYAHDVDGKLTYVSPQSVDFFGYTPEEAMKKWQDFVTDHPENYKIYKYNDRAIKSGEPQPSYEVQIQKANGDKIWVEVNEAPIVKDGETVALVGSLTDIDERKKFQEKLKSSLERYDYVTKASRDAIYDWDIKTNNIHWGEGFQKLFGYDVNETNFPIESWASLVHPADIQAARLNLNDALTSEKTYWSYEYRLRMRNGEYSYVSEHGSIIRDDEGEAIRMVGAIRDITDSKKQQIQKELKQKVSQFFKTGNKLKELMPNLLAELAQEGDFDIAEFWVRTSDESSLLLSASHYKEDLEVNFHDLSSNIKRFKYGEGLPGVIWKTGNFELWDNIHKDLNFVRAKSAEKSGLHSAFGLPLISNEQFIGVLLFGSQKQASEIEQNIFRFDGLNESLGKEIHRKMKEEEFFLLFESAPEIIGVASPDWRFIRVNPAFTKLLGYTEEEISSKPFTEFLHPDDLKSTSKEFEETKTGKRKANNFINRYITKSGDIVWISWYSSDVFGDNEYVFAYGRDVTENKKLEKLLNQTSKLAKVGSWEIRLDNGESDTIFWSETTQDIMQVAENYKPTLTGGFEFYKNESKVKLQRAVEKAIEKGISFDLELNLKTAKGENRWVRCIGDSEFKDDECIRIYGSIQDITEKVEAELERVRILESISDAFYALNSSWEFTYFNAEAESLLNKESDDVLGKNVWELFPESKKTELFEIYSDIIRNKTSRTFEYYYQPIETWLEISAYYHDGGLSVFFRDVTDRKEAQEKLKQLNAELQQQTEELTASNAELEQFAYVASHDLQEPLRMVTSFLTQLDKKYHDQLDERARQYIGFAVDGAQRMRQIILDLLNYSRLTKSQFDWEKIDLNRVVEEVQKLEHNHIDESGAKIEADDLPEVVGIPGSITQLFQNLIHNALKYKKPDIAPIIRIQTKEEKDHWIISVEDNGIGIDLRYREKIFQIFHRLHTREQYSGTGIGLAISKKIVENHGGKIWVESEEEIGSTFYFTIPKESKVRL